MHHGHPFAPTGFSRAESAEEMVENQPHLGISAPEGGCPSPVTLMKAVTSTRPCPRLRRDISITSGQWPTVFSSAERLETNRQPSGALPKSSQQELLKTLAIARLTTGQPVKATARSEAAGHRLRSSPVATALWQYWSPGVNQLIVSNMELEEK